MNLGDGLNIAQVIAKATELLSKDKNLSSQAKNVGRQIGTAKSVKAVASAGALGGAVFGASGASIMSTLASAGAIVGGGVVAGIGLVAGGAGAGAAKLLNDRVFINDRSARIGSYSGAALGTAGSLGALLTAGAGPSGLAAIGSVIGGGMAVGAISLLAFPIVGAALVGGGLYLRNNKEKNSLTRSSRGHQRLRGFLHKLLALSRKQPLRTRRPRF